MAAPRIAVVIPALDEEEAIGAVIREIPAAVHDVIVVDNGSRDRTEEVARAAGARVVSEPRRGYGQACLAGIAAAGGADVLVFLDGDHSDYPAQLVDVVAPILEGRADLVIGSRRRGRREAGAHPWHAVLGTRACVGLMNLLAGSRATDLGPFRAITAEALRRLDMRDRGYGWTVEMQVKAVRRGLRVVEVPVDYRPRIGRSKVSGTVRGTLGAGTKIVATILRHAVTPRDLRRPAPEGSAGIADPSSPDQDGDPREDTSSLRARGIPPVGTRRGWLVSAGFVLSLCVLAWAFGPPPPTRIGPHMALFGAAFAAYLVALAASRGLSRRGLWLCLAVALVWRVLLVAAPPLLSNDINRYVWEGRVQLHGGNPYAWGDRPESPRWLALRDAVYDGLNHKDYTAVYPPLFLLATRAVVALHDSFTAMKAFLVACELATLGALALVLHRRRRPLVRLLVLAWSPLALVEIAGSGHNEAFGMLWMVLALLALDADRPLLSALAASAGFLSKYLPGLVAAAWARRYRWWHVARRRGARRRARRALPRRRLEEDDAAEPLEVRAVLALQRDALRAARRPPRLARGGGARGGLPVPRPRPGSRRAADGAGGRGHRQSWSPRCCSPRTSCPGTRCGSCPCWWCATSRPRSSSPVPCLSRTSSTRAGAPASRGSSAGAGARSSTGRARSSPLAAGWTGAP